jgi:hypothetical protein
MQPAYIEISKRENREQKDGCAEKAGDPDALTSQRRPELIALKAMKGVFPIAMLFCGMVLGWSISTVRGPSYQNADGKRMEHHRAVLETGHGKEGGHPIDITQDVVLIPGQSKEEILKTVRGIVRDPNSRRGMRNFLVMLDGLTPENAPVIREMFASLPENPVPGWSKFQSLFFIRWGEIEGEKAVRAAMDPIPGEGDNLGSVIHGWGQSDMNAALRFAAGLPIGSEERRGANWALMNILAEADLDRAADFVLGQPDAGQNDETLDLLIRKAGAKQRPELYLNWFERVPDGPRKGALALKSIEFLRTKSIEEAVEFVNNAGDASWRNWDMYWPVAADYAKKDPKAALDWVFSLPKFPNELAPPGLAAVVEHWHAQQPAAAKDWLMQNVDQPWWPRAARGIVVSLKSSGNEAGVQQFLSEFTPEARQIIQEDGKKPKPVISR